MVDGVGTGSLGCGCWGEKEEERNGVVRLVGNMERIMVNICADDRGAACVERFGGRKEVDGFGDGGGGAGNW